MMKTAVSLSFVLLSARAGAESAFVLAAEGDKALSEMSSVLKEAEGPNKRLAARMMELGRAAEEKYREALSRDPSYVRALAGSAMVGILTAQVVQGDQRSGHLRKAESFAQDALRKRKGYAPAQMILGESHALQTRWPEAEKAFHALMRGEWVNASLYAWLGYAYGRSGAEETAVKYLDLAVENGDPADAADWARDQTHDKKGRRLAKFKFKAMLPPPLYRLSVPRAALEGVGSSKFRLAVFNLADQTGNAGELVRTIPDILTTGLFNTGRFEIADRGQLRGKSQTEVEELEASLKRDRLADGILRGSITRFSPQTKTMTLDIRVSNAVSDELMFAKSLNVGYTGIMDVQVSRAHLDYIAKDIAAAFPALPAGRVTSSGSSDITLDVGERHGVVKGAAGYVEAAGDFLKDPDSGQTPGSNVFVAEVYVTSVEDKSCRAAVSRRSADVLVGDVVKFK